MTKTTLGRQHIDAIIAEPETIASVIPFSPISVHDFTSPLAVIKSLLFDGIGIWL